MSEKLGFNPPDCSCEFVHCSEPTCRSTKISHGGVAEKDRMFPAQPTAGVPCDDHYDCKACSNWVDACSVEATKTLRADLARVQAERDVLMRWEREHITECQKLRATELELRAELEAVRKIATSGPGAMVHMSDCECVRCLVLEALDADPSAGRRETRSGMSRKPKFRVGQVVQIVERGSYAQVIELIHEGVRLNWDGICFPVKLNRIRELTASEIGPRRKRGKRT